MNVQYKFLIPSFKKECYFPDQLVKNLGDKTLLEHTTDTLCKNYKKQDILIITDSQEITLLCKRIGINYYFDKNLNNINDFFKNITDTLYSNLLYFNIVLVDPYSPFTTIKMINECITTYENSLEDVLVTVKKNDFIITDKSLTLSSVNELFNAIKIINLSKYNSKSKYVYHVVDNEKSLTIKNYQDWWVAEKLLKRKKIVFNVIGDYTIGTGHIARCLTLAKELLDYEVVFVCDKKYSLAVEKITSVDYKVVVTDDVISSIKMLEPDLLINDVLDTSLKFMESLSKLIPIVNFEDFGPGACLAKLVINDLYENNTTSSKISNVLLGYKWANIRNEFTKATKNKFSKNVKNILLTFGGTDPNDITFIALDTIYQKCQSLNINIRVILGPGYLNHDFIKERYSYNKNITFYDNLEVTSEILEDVQLAISSNGRTTFELCHMNIPSIIISHHEREFTHEFANFERGFINLGIFNNNIGTLLLENFNTLINNTDFRFELFEKMKNYCFLENNSRIINKILRLIK